MAYLRTTLPKAASQQRLETVWAGSTGGQGLQVQRASPEADGRNPISSTTSPTPAQSLHGIGTFTSPTSEGGQGADVLSLRRWEWSSAQCGKLL